MQVEWIPASRSQTLDEFSAEHSYSCFLYDNTVYVYFGGKTTTHDDVQYVVKELEKDVLPITLLGSTMVTPVTMNLLGPTIAIPW
jgi:hypothetical protein